MSDDYAPLVLHGIPAAILYLDLPPKLDMVSCYNFKSFKCPCGFTHQMVSNIDGWFTRSSWHPIEWHYDHCEKARVAL